MRLLNYMRQWRGLAKEALERTAIVAKFLCLLHVTDTYLCTPTLVYGPSMLPTLNLTGDVLLAEHLSPRLGKVGSGDVVLVRSPVDPEGRSPSGLWAWRAIGSPSLWIPCTLTGVNLLWYE
ncbi:hypothetical protein SLA2020_266060 [Shorea laevis]